MGRLVACGCIKGVRLLELARNARRLFEASKDRNPDKAAAPQFPGFELLVEERGADNGPSQIWLPFLDTYRTMCLAPPPEFMRLLEQAGGLPIVA
jgi:hypothetical protein